MVGGQGTFFKVPKCYNDCRRATDVDQGLAYVQFELLMWLICLGGADVSSSLIILMVDLSIIQFKHDL